MDNLKPYGVCCTYSQISLTVNVPFVVWHLNVLPQYVFGVLVVQLNGFCPSPYGVNAYGGIKGCGSPVNHEGSMWGSYAGMTSEKYNHGYGIDRATVVGHNLNGNPPQKIVNRDPRSDVSSGRLDKQMDLLDLLLCRNSEAVEKSLSQEVVNRTSKGEINFIGRIRRIHIFLANVPRQRPRSAGADDAQASAVTARRGSLDESVRIFVSFALDVEPRFFFRLLLIPSRGCRTPLDVDFSLVIISKISPHRIGAVCPAI